MSTSTVDYSEADHGHVPRGIPTGYMNALEQRLADTETALFFALAEVHSGLVVQGDYDSQPPEQTMHPTALSTAAPTHQQEKWDLMASWVSQPLKNRAQAQAWLRSRQASTFQFVRDSSSTGLGERTHDTFTPPVANASHDVDALRPPVVHTRAKISRAPRGIRRERKYGARWLDYAGIMQFDTPEEIDRGGTDSDRTSKAKSFARGNQNMYF